MDEEQVVEEATEESTTPGGSILDTPELKAEAPPAQAHEGRIVSVEANESDKGSVGMKFILEAPTRGGQDEYTLWLPADFVADIHVDPNELPAEEGNNQHSQYVIGISNSDGDATLQVLRRIALEQRPGALEGQTAPSNAEEYIALHNTLLAGTNLIYLLAVEKKAEPPFNKRLKVQRFYPPDAKENPKMFKRVKKAWLGEV